MGKNGEPLDNSTLGILSDQIRPIRWERHWPLSIINSQILLRSAEIPLLLLFTALVLLFLLRGIFKK